MSYLFVFLSGIVTALPLLWDVLSPVAWLSMFPLFAAAMKGKAAFRHGLVFGIGYYGVMFYWFVCLYPMDFAGLSNAMSVAVICVAWIGMTLLQSLTTALVSLLIRWGRSDNAAVTILLCGFAFTVGEWTQTQTWMGVPWGRLALTQVGALPAVQSASLFGSLFIGFLMALVNACAAHAYLSLKETGRLPKAAFAGALIVLLNYGYGIAALAMPLHDTGETIRAAAIQGNIASGDKWADDSVATSLALYEELTRQAVNESGATLIVWPETVLTTYVRTDLSSAHRLSALAKETGATLIVGCFDFDGKGTERNTYNALMLFHPDGTRSETAYYKRHLVPFGEYLPMAAFFETVLPFMGELNLFSSSITEGTDPCLMETEEGRIGGLVCFDSIYETLTLDSVRAGAELIVLSTNDSWYRDSAAVYQHNSHAALRAIESGRYIVRAANTGVSSLITPRGETVKTLGPLLRGYVTGEIAYCQTRTLYQTVGNLVVWVSFAGLALCFAGKIVRLRCAKRKSAGQAA